METKDNDVMDRIMATLIVKVLIFIFLPPSFFVPLFLAINLVIHWTV